MEEEKKAELLLSQGKALARLAGSYVRDPELDEVLKNYALGKITREKALSTALSIIMGGEV